MNKYFLGVFQFWRVKKMLPWLVGLGLFLIVLCLGYRLWTGEQEYNRQLVNREILEIDYVLSNQLNGRISNLERMGRHWQVHQQIYGKLNLTDWELDTQSYYQSYPDYEAIAHINTQGKAEWIIPQYGQLPATPDLSLNNLFVGKKAAVILKLLMVDSRPILSKELREQAEVLGDQDLPTQNLLIVIPLGKLGDRQDDLIVGVLPVQTLLNNILKPYISKGVGIRIWIDDQEIYRSIQNTQNIQNIQNTQTLPPLNFEQSLSNAFKISLHNTEWRVLLQFPAPLTQQRGYFLPWIVLLGGTILSIGFGVLIHFAQTNYLKTQQIRRINQNLQKEIQQRQVVEVDLKKQQETLQTVFDHIPVMLAFYDRQGHIQGINKELERVMGWSVADYQDHDVFNISYPDPQDQERFYTHMITANGEWLDVMTKTKSGDTIATSWANITLSDGSHVGIGQDITERKRIEKLLLQKIQQEQTLNRVIAMIRNSLDLNQIFTTAAAEIARLLTTDRADIVEYLPQEAAWKTVAAYRYDMAIPDTLGTKIPDQGNTIATRLKKLKVVRLGNAADADDEINQELARSFPGAWLLIPLHFRGVVWGSLTLARHRQLQSWSDTDEEIAMSVANQLAIAIHQSQLHQELQKFNINLERQIHLRTLELQRALSFEATLKRITDKVRDSLDENQILQTVVQELQSTLEVDCCHTVIYNSDRSTATVTYEATRGGVPSHLGQVFQTADFPEIFQHLDQGKYTAFCQLESNYLHQNSSLLICPIINDLAIQNPNNQALLRDFWLFKPKSSSFGDIEIRLVEQVANQCAIAIRQAQLYQASQQQVTELEKLNLLKDDFLKTISHELRTPISSIKIATEMLEILLDCGNHSASDCGNHSASDCGNHSASDRAGIFQGNFQEIEPYLRILREESTREEKLINDLLYLTCLESGTEPLDLTTIQLQYWIPYIIETFVERTNSQQQYLYINIPKDFPEFITDVSILERIIVELLNNACKYTPAGETIFLTAELAQSPKGDILPHLKIKVINTGVEIPLEERERIFDKFYRIPNRDPWRYGGTGLGLALVKKLAQYLGATIEVESNQGQTCFTIDLGQC